jgi:outer membrane protein assembly factor BamB
MAPGNRIGDVTASLYFEMNDNPYLAVIWQEPVDFWNSQTYLGLYDCLSNTWVYEKQIMNIPDRNGVLLAPAKIYNEKIYANIGYSIVCHELSTGNQLWKKDFLNDFMFSGFIIEDGKLIANNEDLFAICLDPDTGRQIWKVNTAGTGSMLSYLNGIVYFVGGSVRRLFAIDASTGKIVWKIDPSLLGEGSGAGFRTNAVYVIPAKDGKPAKVIALSDLNAYCFEAYK